MNTETRTFHTEIAERFFTPQDRAVTIHHPGQLTVGGYRRLDLVDPRHIHGLARVRTGPCPDRFECIGHLDGWLVRAELSQADVAGCTGWRALWRCSSCPLCVWSTMSPASRNPIPEQPGCAVPAVPGWRTSRRC